MILSIEELRRWCARHTKRGKGKHRNDKNREFAVLAFLRFIDWKEQEFYKWIGGTEAIPSRVQRTMSKFVADWEAGFLECTPYKPMTKRQIVRRTIPKRRTRLVAHIAPSGVSLSFLPRPTVSPGMPSFRELIRPRLTK